MRLALNLNEIWRWVGAYESVCAVYLEAQLQGDFEQRDVRQAVHEGGDFEGILGEFEDVWGGVDVLLDGL